MAIDQRRLLRRIQPFHPQRRRVHRRRRRHLPASRFRVVDGDDDDDDDDRSRDLVRENPKAMEDWRHHRVDDRPKARRRMTRDVDVVDYAVLSMRVRSRMRKSLEEGADEMSRLGLRLCRRRDYFRHYARRLPRRGSWRRSAKAASKGEMRRLFSIFPSTILEDTVLAASQRPRRREIPNCRLSTVVVVVAVIVAVVRATAQGSVVAFRADRRAAEATEALPKLLPSASRERRLDLIEMNEVTGANKQNQMRPLQVI